MQDMHQAGDPGLFDPAQMPDMRNAEGRENDLSDVR